MKLNQLTQNRGILRCSWTDLRVVDTKTKDNKYLSPQNSVIDNLTCNCPHPLSFSGLCHVILIENYIDMVLQKEAGITHIQTLRKFLPYKIPHKAIL
jgi:hypothetical protein